MSAMEKKTHGRILVELADIWIMEGREDLFDDFVEDVCSEYDFYNGTMVEETHAKKIYNSRIIKKTSS